MNILRANTKKEKQQVIGRLLNLWLKFPQMRLMQLINNVYHEDLHCPDLYYIENYDFINGMEQFYGQTMDTFEK